jgi:hypothetical protein
VKKIHGAKMVRQQARIRLLSAALGLLLELTAATAILVATWRLLRSSSDVEKVVNAGRHPPDCHSWRLQP